MATAWSQRPSGGDHNRNRSSSSQQQQQQQEIYEKLKEYEARRRLAYSAKYDSISLYWKSYCDLLSASLRETSRAQRIILGTSHAYLMYAEAMLAISEDTFLDEKGNITTDKHKKKAASGRKKLDGPTSKSSEAKDAVSVLKGIREAQGVLAERFEESSKNMDEEIAAAIGQLLDTVQEAFVVIERLGSSILTELERTEQEVTQAWATYLNSKSVSGTGVSGGAGTVETAPKSAADPWVVEMQYRVAVAYQNKAWDKGNEELQKLFDRVKQEEISRRMNLREFLVAFAQRQQRLFLSLPGIQNKVLEELVGKEMSRDEMDKAVHTIIEERAAKYKKDGTAGSDMTLDDDFADFSLESPLASDLLGKAKVVLRKGTGLDWTMSLAVLTADSFFHLFDIESSNIKLTTSPEVAFTALAPTLVIPNADNRLMGKSNFGKSWSDPLTPSESMILGKCSVKQLDETTFELIETIAASGASKFMTKKTKRRVQIQTPTKEETDDWIQILTA